MIFVGDFRASRETETSGLMIRVDDIGSTHLGSKRFKMALASAAPGPAPAAAAAAALLLALLA
eukprot:COSAG06_NODE_47124_length_341_cov_1.119835_1_plen_62_part_10